MLVVVLLWCFGSLSLLVSSIPSAVIQNSKVEQKWDLHAAIVTLNMDITVTTTEPVTEYAWYFPHALANQLSYSSAFISGKTVNVNIVPEDSNDQVKLMVNVPISDLTWTLKFEGHFTHLLIPFPSEMTQMEDHYVQFTTPLRLSSPYATTTQTLSLKLGSSDVKSVTKLEGVKRSGSRVTCGPYKDVPADKEDNEKLTVHFHHRGKFITLTSVTKEFEISMYGMVSVEEVDELVHTGAKLKGGFSRIDYDSERARGNSYDTLTAILPRRAENVYYRDIIGNITTSKLRKESKFQHLSLRPRFPMFGGWKTQWYMGYIVPTEDVLYHNGSTFQFMALFPSHVVDATVDEMTVKVILPEGAKNAQAKFPWSLDEESETTRLTYLDSQYIGRPVLIFRKKNVIPKHNSNTFTVTFEFEHKYMLHEVFLLVGSYLAFFVLSMVLTRCSLRLDSGQKKKLE